MAEVEVEPPQTCTVCGAASTERLDPLTWSLEVDGDDHRWTCVDCARSHVRDMEGRLDLAYWTFE